MTKTTTEDGRRLAGKTALVTGGTTGIGLETARRYLAQGAQVMITGQNEQRLASAARDLSGSVLTHPRRQSRKNSGMTSST